MCKHPKVRYSHYLTFLFLLLFLLLWNLLSQNSFRIIQKILFHLIIKRYHEWTEYRRACLKNGYLRRTARISKDFTGPFIEKIFRQRWMLISDTRSMLRMDITLATLAMENTPGISSPSRELPKIEIPRDRNGEFEPQIMSKFQTRTTVIEDKIINIYTLGLVTTDIQVHLWDIYGAVVSRDLVSILRTKFFL